MRLLLSYSSFGFINLKQKERVQSSLENFHIASAALRALIDEYHRIMEAGMQGTPLDAKLVRQRLTEIEMRMNDAAVKPFESADSQPHAALWPIRAD